MYSDKDYQYEEEEEEEDEPLNSATKDGFLKSVSGQIINTCIKQSRFTIKQLIEIMNGYNRRIYDIIIILRSIGIISKTENKKEYQWEGSVGFQKALERGFDIKSNTPSGLVCQFVLLIRLKKETFSLNEVREKLKTKKRRLYDIVNVLIVLGLMEKSGRNVYKWLSDEKLLIDSQIPLKKRKF
jgi:E2F/DP family winged-helix DNA-binding domain